MQSFRKVDQEDGVPPDLDLQLRSELAADRGADPDPVIDGTADQVGQHLSRLLRVIARMRQQSDMGAGHVLGLLIDKGPQRVGEIAGALATDPSTASRKVAALVEAGLVERRPDPADGRAHLLAATAAGERQCVAGRRHRIELVAAVPRKWPDGAGRQSAVLLGRPADGLQEQDRRATRVGPGRRAGGEN